jgi:hypothetical protein
MKGLRVRLLLFLCAAFAAGAPAQDGPCVIDGGISYRYTDVGDGTTRVTEQYYWAPMDQLTETPRGDVTRAELQAYYQGLLRDSALVFLAEIDSVIQLPAGDSSTPLVPWKTLSRPQARGTKYFRFYARLRVDTVFKGSLPLPSFWIEGLRRETCEFQWGHFKGKRFLNASAAFEAMSDLKIDLERIWHPQLSGHWFDGRYLVTPPYYGVRLDITHVLPAYPATGLSPRRPAFSPAHRSGKAWLPNGREAPGFDARGNPVPVLR